MTRKYKKGGTTWRNLLAEISVHRRKIENDKLTDRRII